MCCLATLLLVLGPRFGIFLYWLYDPARWSAVFNGGFLVPFLGFLFLPWTTLAYVVVWSVGGLDPFGWFVVAMGFLADAASYTGGAISNRDRISAMSS